jgi:hypothetical protein
MGVDNINEFNANEIFSMDTLVTPLTPLLVEAYVAAQ